jgi:hypothetical protein
MKWRESVRQAEKQEAEREAVECKIEEHLKVLWNYSIRTSSFMGKCGVLCTEMNTEYF